MTRGTGRGLLRRLLPLAAVAGLAVSCGYVPGYVPGYVATVPPVEDAVEVRPVSGLGPDNDHPVRMTARDLTAILKAVRVRFKANWIQRYLTGPLEPVPLFDEASLARVVPPLVEALGKAGPRDRIVFYVAHRRSNDRRDVTSGTLFVRDRLLNLVLANHLNRVDVVPGLLVFDRKDPELAVAPQWLTLVFDRPEFQVDREPDFVDGVFGAAPPRLRVNYGLFLAFEGRNLAAPCAAHNDAPRNGIPGARPPLPC
jgi:hypothetical protein